jgi:hypothetical protein
MAVTLIFNWKGSGLKARRSTAEKEMQKEWGTSSLDEEKIDKCDFLERQAVKEGIERPGFLKQKDIDKVK